eukprot:7381272-Prymnesium_polylepis.1
MPSCQLVWKLMISMVPFDTSFTLFCAHNSNPSLAVRSPSEICCTLNRRMSDHTIPRMSVMFSSKMFSAEYWLGIFCAFRKSLMYLRESARASATIKPRREWRQIEVLHLLEFSHLRAHIAPLGAAACKRRSSPWPACCRVHISWREGHQRGRRRHAYRLELVLSQRLLGDDLDELDQPHAVPKVLGEGLDREAFTFEMRVYPRREGLDLHTLARRLRTPRAFASCEASSRTADGARPQRMRTRHCATSAHIFAGHVGTVSVVWGLMAY